VECGSSERQGKPTRGGASPATAVRNQRLLECLEGDHQAQLSRNQANPVSINNDDRLGSRQAAALSRQRGLQARIRIYAPGKEKYLEKSRAEPRERDRGKHVPVFYE
jgi:hypothetical protein